MAARSLERVLQGVKICASTPLAVARSRSPSSFKKTPFSASSRLLQPHLTTSSLQQQQQHEDKASLSPQNPELDTARPYSEIPKTKTFLGLNLDVLRNPAQVGPYMREQADTLGPIFRLAGVPGIPEMVALMDVDDVERAFRAGDSGYPSRFPFTLWIESRKELRQPLGLFLE